MRSTFATLAVTFLTATLSAQDSWTPPRLQSGLSPATPISAVSAGEVFLEVTVTDRGAVSHIDVLRTTPPFTDMVLAEVRGWTFLPAERTSERTSGTPPSTVTELVTETVASKVFVAAIFRPPAVNTPTLGSPPADAAAPTEEVASPVTSVTPGFPVQALHDGTVLTEVTIGPDGGVTSAEIVQSSPSFDEVALVAARQWSFRPARVNGQLEQTYGYITFAFRAPITGGSPMPVR